MTFAVAVTIGGSSVTAQTLQGISINYGRTSLDQQPNPTSCSLEIVYGSNLGTVTPNDWNLGDTVEVILTPTAGVGKRRFYGRITDMTMNWRTVAITAISDTISSLSRITTSVAPFTAALAGSTMTTVMTTAAATLPVGAPFPLYTFSTGTVQMTSPGETSITVLDALQTIANSEPSGTLFELVETSTLRFEDYNDRRVGTSVLTFASTEVVQDWRITRSIDSLTNYVTTTYSAGSSIYSSTSSITSLGQYESTIDTILTNADDATFRSRQAVAFGTRPGWSLDGVVIPLGTLSTARQTAIRDALVFGAQVTIPSLATGVATTYFVEGWDERIERSIWDLTLYLSDVTLTQAGQRWSDVTPTRKWNEVSTSITWDLALTQNV
jgi:hypothetical protein